MNYYQPPKTAARIAQCLPLAMSTDKTGECFAAIQATRRALESAGLDHCALASAIETGLQTPAPTYDESDWRRIAELWGRRDDLLSAKERAFIAVIARYRRRPNERQLEWLNGIAQRIRSTQ